MDFRIVIFATVLGICIAKPYHHRKGDEKTKIFRDELVVPPGGAVGFSESQVAHQTSKGRWMSWSPAQDTGYVSQESKESQEYTGWDKEESKETEEENLADYDKTHSNEDIPSDPCKNVYCHYGRVCRITPEGRGECRCADQDFCAGHSKPVCGTDGNVYPSHCELHRVACIKEMHIGIDHTGKQCKHSQSQQEDHSQFEHVDDETTRERHHRKNHFEVEEPIEEDNKVEEVKVTLEKLQKGTETPKYDYADFEPKPEFECTELEYSLFKNNLLQFHCARIGETSCGEESQRKQFVANIMFNYFDRNSNQLLDERELVDIESRDRLDKLSRYCGLPDLLEFDDEDKDGSIALMEFYKAFSIPSVILEDRLKTFTTQVSAGNSIELKCDIKGAVEVVWKRNGVIITQETATEIKTFDDGSLYINDLSLHHMGNYSCMDKFNPHVIQTHILRVQMPPTVRVSPSTQFHTTGANVVLKCHADGVPEPEVSWEMNESPLQTSYDGHYVSLQNNSTLEIRKAIYTKDTGAYKCKARNPAGVGQDIATVFIENSKVPQYSGGEELYEVFVVFHDKGYTVYEPGHCHIEHVVSATFNMFKILPDYGDSITSLCDPTKPCSWGTAVNVRNKFIYITQPELNRVVVIEIQDRSNPVEIIPTDKVPVAIHYVEHLDQVWVLCWNTDVQGDTKTTIVIRQASEDIQHHTVHTQPIANRFDLVRDVFLPANNDLKHKFNHGYVVHHEQQGLHKLDLEAMKYVKTIDLNDHECIPKNVAFVPLGGQLLVHCESPAGKPAKSTQLVIDYVTDAVLSKSELPGAPYISPDGRYMVLLDEEGDTITVHRIHDDGKIEKLYDEYTNLQVSDVTFFPSERGRSYDFYASSTNKNDVLFMDLASGKVEMIEGVGQSIDPAEWKWSKHNRVIVGGGVFGEYLMTPSKDSVVVIDGRRRHVQCEWQEIAHGNVIVWVEPLHL